MISCFFTKFFHVATIPLEDRKTVTVDCYANHSLPEVFQARYKRRPRTGVRGLLLHHDNARAYTAAVTLNFLAVNDIQLVTHPPYSPDLADYDFFVSFRQKAVERKAVSKRKRYPCILRGRHFGHTQSTWSGVIDSWFERMIKCIQVEGGFF